MVEIHLDEDGPDWIQPSITYPYVHEETKQRVVTVSFTLPFENLDTLFMVLSNRKFQAVFDAELNDFMVEHFDEILQSMGEEV